MNCSYGYYSRRIEFKWFVIFKYLQYNIEYKLNIILNIYYIITYISNKIYL